MRDKLQGTLGGYRESFLTGSYARHTAIAPLKDIDVFVVIDQEDRRDLFDGTAWRCINAVRAATKDALPRLAQEPRLQKRSVGVGFATAGLRVELVPAFTTGQEGVFRIADRHAERWILSAPQIHAAISTEANHRSGGLLKPVIKLLKAWKRQHDLPIKSFHLEVMCYSAPISPSHTLSEALAWAFSHLSQAIDCPCPDPARVGDSIDIAMAPQDREVMAYQLSRCAQSSRWRQLISSHATWSGHTIDGAESLVSCIRARIESEPGSLYLRRSPWTQRGASLLRFYNVSHQLLNIVVTKMSDGIEQQSWVEVRTLGDKQKFMITRNHESRCR